MEEYSFTTQQMLMKERWTKSAYTSAFLDAAVGFVQTGGGDSQSGLWSYTSPPSGGRFLQGTPKQRLTSDKTESELKGISMPLAFCVHSSTLY